MEGLREGWRVRGRDGEFEGEMEGLREGWRVRGRDGEFEGEMESLREGWRVRGRDGGFERGMEMSLYLTTDVANPPSLRSLMFQNNRHYSVLMVKT